MSDAKNNAMGPVRPADEETKIVFRAVKQDVIDRLHQLKHFDNVHNLTLLDNLKEIDFYKLTEYAIEEVAYGINYFGKLEIDEGSFIFVRVHKSNDGSIELYSIRTDDDTAIFTADEPLVYFID